MGYKGPITFYRIEKSFFFPEVAKLGPTRKIWGICMEKLQKTFPKITRMYKYFFSKCSKWAHFQFGGTFYEYLQLQGAFFENFDFSAISGRLKVKISWFFQFFAKFWPLTGHKWPKNQNFQKRLFEVVDIHKNFLQTENGPIWSIWKKKICTTV